MIILQVLIRRAKTQTRKDLEEREFERRSIFRS